jgi:hypothetical protein
MKKILLGTTALVASGLLATPAFAADPIKINVIGYLQTYIGLGHFDKDGITGANKYNPVNFKYEGEIWFQGQTKLDNGTSIGLRIELEAWSQGGIAGGAPTADSGISDTKDTVDEEYLFAFGDWGRIEFGGTDVASYKMTYTTPTALIGHSFVQHNFGWRWQHGGRCQRGGSRRLHLEPGPDRGRLEQAHLLHATLLRLPVRRLVHAAVRPGTSAVRGRQRGPVRLPRRCGQPRRLPEECQHVEGRHRRRCELPQQVG